MVRFANLVLTGLTSGAIYAVFALLLTVLFRVSNVLNLAIGDFAMLGVFGVNVAIFHGVSTPLAIALALVSVGAFGYLYDRSVLGSALSGKRPQDALLFTMFLTYALSFFIEGATPRVLGNGVFFDPDLWPGAPFHVGPVPVQRVGVLVVALALATGLAFVGLFRFSLKGKALAACGENAVGARLVGIRQPSYRRGMFVAMCVLAAGFGIVEAPLSGFTVTSGFGLGLTGILAAAIAGFSRPGQAVVVGIGIGLAEAFIGGYISTQYAEVLLYSLVTVIVLYSPRVLGPGIHEGRSTGTLASSQE